VLPQIINFIFEKKTRNIAIVGGSVDAYYHDAFTKFWELMESDLRDVVLTTENPEVWFFGHSLGGGLASITSTVVSAIKLVPSDRIKLVTFGQPRITDNLFAERHDDLVPYSFRIINRHDGLTSVPTRMSEMEKTGPFHHRYEVWYPDGMSQGARFVVSAIPEDGFGHDTIDLLLDVDDHVTMFDVVIGDWWQNNCTNESAAS
uniref:Lipase_3 domain-containing protein n=1 Tax=Ascaris lumbricoides TaxID=6252 RepID=A0A0M3HXU4_ASCLU